MPRTINSIAATDADARGPALVLALRSGIDSNEPSNLALVPALRHDCLWIAVDCYVHGSTLSI